MKFKSIVGLVFIGLLSASGAFASAHKAHWGYSGEEGPENWGQLSHDYIMCSAGKNQSPINLTSMVEGDLPQMTVEYFSKGTEVLNNGHAIQVNVADGSTIRVKGHTFALKQFHFHSPSENTIDGRSFPLEAHFVHLDENGNIAVVAVMFEEGAVNLELEKAWALMPAHAGEKAALKETISPVNLLPAERDYFRFNGSLTTPPCTEGVNWFVMKDAITASKAQIEKFQEIMERPNNRPVQPVNSRIIIK